MLRMIKILLDKAGDGKGGGGAGAGGQNAGNGQSGSGAGAGGDAGAGGAANGAAGDGKSGGVKDELFGDSGNNAGNNGGDGKDGKDGKNNTDGKNGQGDGGAKLPDNWKELLPDDLKSEGSLGPIKDIPTLVKSYINAQKMIGADKLPIPGKDATEAEWTEAFHKLGNPRSLEEYKVELAKDASIEKEFVDKFKVQAHKLGVLPKQAQAMVEWFDALNKATYSDADKAHTNKLNADMAALRQEWGSAFDGNLLKSKAALNEFSDEGTKKFMQDSALGTRAAFIKFMAKVGETLSEDKIRGGGGNQNMFGALSPAQALEKINEIKGNAQSPYWNDKHEKHGELKKEMASLFTQAYPSKK